ncbi:MAG TPA: uroporphyrinogen-III C-methyltransferase [Candidatus Binatia bacterium]|nr:uroporphyrinogen-III C-methyltransferase [Candidatus Binatia bacterium]
MSGKVYLVGAGPGDPELITVKARRLLRSADAVLHDDLVAPEILALVSSRARVQNVGKRCGRKSVRQEEINFLMIALASSGKRVVRLKGGDPLIFGRSGEEIDALRRANIEYEIVPGVTSALGAAAAAGIPLTQRGLASTLILTAGHLAEGRKRTDWSKFSSSDSTLVVYMPGHGYDELADKLTAAGFASETPVAVISRATTPQQKIHRTNLAGLLQSPILPAPSLIVVGEVVNLSGRRLETEFSNGLIPQTAFSLNQDAREFDEVRP